MPHETATPTAAAERLADFTRLELIVPRLRERDAAGIIGELSRVLAQSDCVPDVLSFYQAALNQEILADGAARSGIAIAHARLSGVKRLQFALGRAPAPVAWNSRNSCRVRLVFLLAVPATEATHYLHLLANLARLGRHAPTLAELLKAPDAAAMLAVLQETDC
jgi:mannitol/fructose-specific phosphotransferase system IIA component (Ntr-type)